MSPSSSAEYQLVLGEFEVQINALTAALNQIRSQYKDDYELEQKQKQKQEQDEAVQKSKSSSWGSSIVTKVSSSQHPYSVRLTPLPEGQHPLVLAIWSRSTSPRSYQDSLGMALVRLIQEKLNFLQETSLGRPLNRHKNVE